MEVELDRQECPPIPPHVYIADTHSDEQTGLRGCAETRAECRVQHVHFPLCILWALVMDMYGGGVYGPNVLPWFVYLLLNNAL